MRTEIDYILEVEAVLTDEYKGRAYAWAEAQRDLAHWDAHNEWEFAVHDGMEPHERLPLAKRWRDETVAMFERFKEAHGISDAAMWASDLRGGE